MDLESARAFVTAVIEQVAPHRRYGRRPTAVFSAPAGVSEVTAICFGGVISHRSCQLAGEELTEALHHYLREEHQIMVG
ncbi:actin-like ATPase involved in cell morphogenesis, partial [Rhodococcus sp. BE178]